MKIKEIINESIDDIEILLRFDSNFSHSYQEIEEGLKVLIDLTSKYSVSNKAGLQNAALKLNVIASEYLDNPRRVNVKSDPDAIMLRARIEKVKTSSIDIFNDLITS